MKILVFAHDLVFGGTTVNAVELAAALRDLHGHDVVLYATPGPMSKLVAEKGLSFLPAPVATVHPSPARMKSLRDAVRSTRPDVLHVWEAWPCVDAFYSAHLTMRIPMVVTDMGMTLHRVLPKTLPTTFGTPELVDRARAAGRRRVELLLPPVDTAYNAPGTVDPMPFREQWGIQDSDIVLVTVSRLAESMKGESLSRTIHAVRSLGRELPVRLVIVGDGTARTRLQQLADETNRHLGRAAVVLTGVRLDPRPAYSAADIVVGMGSSALRGMAFGKPVVIVGEQGFSAPFTPATENSFYYKGIYGRGVGGSSNQRLVADILGLVERRDSLPALGEFSRQFVVQHFSLEAVAARLGECLRRAVDEMPRFHVSAADGLRTAAVYLRERRFLWRSLPPAPIENIDG
jgi:glycosyltransferase involved in cell wall biosynthesis